jgi:hypothetical protein
MIKLCCVCLVVQTQPDTSVATARRITMAKSQLRGNKEAKKPKKPKQVVVPVGTFITPPKVANPVKTRH